MTIIVLATNILIFINRIVVPFIFTIAFLVFIWGIFQYFIAGGADAEKREQGRNLALSGIIGFFVMISVWGLVNILVGTFGLGGVPMPPIPSFNGVGGLNSTHTCIVDDECGSGTCRAGFCH